LGNWQWHGAGSPIRKIPVNLRDTSMALFAPGSNGAILTVGGRGARLRLASDIAKASMSYRPQTRVHSIAFSPDSRMLASAGDDGSIKLWRLDEKPVDPRRPWVSDRTLLDHGRSVNSVVFHPKDNELLLSAHKDGAVKLWKRSAGEWKAEMLGGNNAGQGAVHQAVFSSSDGAEPVQIFAVTDQGIQIWDLEGKPIDKISQKGARCAAVSPNREWIAAGVGSDAIVWNLKTKQKVDSTLSGHSADITSLAFSPDGQRLLTASKDHNVKIWDTKPWSEPVDANQPVQRELLTLEQHVDSVASVSFFPSTKFPSLLTAGADGQAILWPSRSE
jgi:WD40 repeat protein